MFALNTFWVNLTNIALGLATIICFAVVIYAAGKEIVKRVANKSRAKVREQDDAHVLNVPELGVTMTDGGEKLYDDDERAFG